MSVGEPPDPAAAAGPAEFLDRLRQLRLWAGQPSLRRLRALAGAVTGADRTGVAALPVSTISYALRGDRLPRMEFVRAFVSACLRARGRSPSEVAAQVERWHEAWLRVSQAGQDPPAPDRPATAAVPVPRQLPADVAGFTGRDDELELLRKALAGAGRAGPVVVPAIDGAGGVGKSALALHVAHQLAEEFPDGQLYVDLHGSTAGLAPLVPREVLGRFLRALGVAGNAVPDQVDEAAARFRTQLAGRQLLLVLDNAVDEAQVRPLLPGTPGCRVLVTSRKPLAGLPGASHICLDLLSEPESVTLLARLVGAERVAAEPAAAAELVRRCGRLPLALRIAGARLAARPGWPIATLAERLASEQRRLDELELADLGVRASIAVSQQALARSDDPTDRAAAEAYQLLGVWDGPDLSVPLAARLLERTEADAERMLERLVDARLLESPTPGRYRMHDLLRLHARERAAGTYPGPVRTAALARVLRLYTATARHSRALLHPGASLPGPAIPPPTGGTRFDGAEAALNWLDAERPNLMAGVASAAAVPELAEPAIELTGHLFDFFVLRGHWRDWAELSRTALALARRAGDRTAEARALSGIGAAYGIQGRYGEAITCHRQSLAIRQEVGDRAGEAASLNNLGLAHSLLARYPEAEDFHRRSLAIRQDLGDRYGQAYSLSNLGSTYRAMGRHDDAGACFQQSLAMFRQIGDAVGQAASLGGLGEVHMLLGRYGDAGGCLRRKLGIARKLGDRVRQAESLRELGALLNRQGRYQDALAHCRRSLAICRDLGSRHDEVRALRGMGEALRGLGLAGQARARWREALAICEELGIPADEVRALLAGS